jgi:hypothetical protein
LKIFIVQVEQLADDDESAQLISKEEQRRQQALRAQRGVSWLHKNGAPGKMPS